MKFEVHADDVRLNVHKDDFGALVPELANASNGRVLVEFGKAEIEAMVLAFAKAAVEPKVRIEGVDLTLAQAGERGVLLTARVKARQMMAATVVVSGRADVDPQLNVMLSDLACRGDGMAGTLAAGFILPKLRAYEGRQFAMPIEQLRTLRLNNVSVDAGDPLRITARFA